MSVRLDAVPVAWTVGPQVRCPAGPYPMLFLAQARRRPDAVAVRQWGETLTYRQLADCAAALAGQLRRLGVGPEDRVAICVRRRPTMVGAVLGVLLSGAAYVPVDPDSPAPRRVGTLDDSGAVAVVVDAETAALLDTDRPVLTLSSTVDFEGAWPDCPARPDNAGYVLFTSGSTGRPKGVVVTHRSLVSFAVAFGGHTGATERTRAFGFASLGFDVSVIDMLVPLAAGGEVALVSEADRADPARLQHFVEEHRVTWGCLPVALLPLLDPARLPAWQTVITGAEAPGPEQVERWTGVADPPRRRFLNCYGPTEATVCVTGYETAGRWDRPLPMGGPLANHRVQVVDAGLEPVPPGVPGELLVGGAGLARGYLGSPGLTAERFVPDPFGGEPGGRLYRTGDRVVWLDGGALLFLGRTDRQVKVRGQRVEVGELETVLRGHPDVVHAVVETTPAPDGLALVACYTPTTGPDPAALRAWCAQRLPAALVPSRALRLETLPLTASGKVDSAALRALVAAGAATPGAAAPGAAGGAAPGAALAGVPAEVAALWAEVLGMPAGQARPEDDFFAAGGHSIAAMRLVAALRARLARDVAVEDVFAGRTLAGIAARLAQAPPLDGGDLPSGSAPALSSAQRRLWFVDKLAPESVAYNIAFAERLHGPVDTDALRDALGAVAARHEVLRWRVPDAGGTPYVAVDPPSPAELPVTDLSTLDVPARDEALRGWLRREATGRFTLATGPLWRARLLRLAPDDHVLALTFHHAVFDGWSQRPYLADLGKAYAAAAAGHPTELLELPTGFADYVTWRAERDTRRGDADLAWWAGHLAGTPPVLDLPRDRPRPGVQAYSGAQVHGLLSAATSAAVRSLAARLGVTPPTVLLAGFAHLVHRLTGADELVIGTPAADRRHVAFHDLVGFFIDVLPLRVRLAPGASLATQARRCADELLDVLAHPAAPLERVVEALGLPRDPGRSPLVQVLFNVHNFPEPRLLLPGVRTERVAPGLPGSAFDLTVYIVERDRAFAVDVIYNPELFDAARMRALVDAYTELLDGCCADPEAAMSTVVCAGLDRLVTPGPASGEPGPASGEPGPAGGPAPALRPAAAVASTAPATETERAVARVWSQVLARPVRSADENFFDLGGTSMTAVVVQARLTELLRREVQVVDVFRYPNVRALAAYLDGVPTGIELDRAAARAAARRDRGQTRNAERGGRR